jgi:hypothetical protein
VAATVGSLRKPLGKTLILASLDAGAHDALDELGWKSRKAIRSGETASERGDGERHVQDFSQLFKPYAD